MNILPEEGGAGAVHGMERLCEALAGPDGKLSRTNWNVRVRDLAITYPSLDTLARRIDGTGRFPVHFGMHGITETLNGLKGQRSLNEHRL